jgi:hypothetical protein
MISKLLIMTTIYLPHPSSSFFSPANATKLYLFAGSGGYLRPAKRVNTSTEKQLAAPFSTLSPNIVAPKSDRPNGPATARLTTPKPELPVEASTDYVSEDEPENVLCMKETDRAGVGRWFLDIDKWQVRTILFFCLFFVCLASHYS